MTDNTDLYGTQQPSEEGRDFSFGPWSFTLEAGGLRHITLNGVEAIRGISFLARDRDWGTLIPQIEREQIISEEQKLSIFFDEVFENSPSKLTVQIEIELSNDSLRVVARGEATGAFETNRSGFTILHPITDVAGREVQVGHGDGSIEEGKFPDLIAPWQPFIDITSLRHRVGSASVTCKFSGDTFEMEDQRQWGDASFKTYNRALSKPWPYSIEDRERISQSVVLTWASGQHATSNTNLPLVENAVFPEMALVITPDDATRLSNTPSDLELVNPQRLLCHFDMTLGAHERQLRAFAKAQSICKNVSYDLELICALDEDPMTELAKIASLMQRTGFEPSSILICPSVDRQSTPPGSDWPDCPPLEEVHAAAACAFPSFTRGGGMVSFFPELNRKRPPVEMLDFVSHGLCPIVHAADDKSVWETLETIPHITRSARAIIGAKSYRIGPATIGMRQNPYGARTIPNPHNKRICMAADDPRHRAKFGAVYAIGLATALAQANVDVWTPAALYGPRGVVAGKEGWPISSALRFLACSAGLSVEKAEINKGSAYLHVGDQAINANLTDSTIDGLGPFEWQTTKTRQ